ncbi:hypothetical protein TEQG_03160 [Trichophyton equinum CBS 127.97]|uniref:Uncharacterized protein n=1 Tax=Trichophyton equinum (strain ATCC MYA-4606 / CBS 127.97) TaxID=559882 RepID=F2PQG0_TRIEC|nr:hypothetical protein TEQG_03160 [Trichophyton equinum CBS 127.97]
MSVEWENTQLGPRPRPAVSVVQARAANRRCKVEDARKEEQKPRRSQRWSTERGAHVRRLKRPKAAGRTSPLLFLASTVGQQLRPLRLRAATLPPRQQRKGWAERIGMDREMDARRRYRRLLDGRRAGRIRQITLQ